MDGGPQYIYDRSRNMIVKEEGHAGMREDSTYQETHTPKSERARDRSNTQGKGEIPSNGRSGRVVEGTVRKGSILAGFRKAAKGTKRTDAQKQFPIPNPAEGTLDLPLLPPRVPRRFVPSHDEGTNMPPALPRSEPSEAGDSRYTQSDATTDDMPAIAGAKLFKIAGLILQSAQNSPELKGDWIEDPVGAVRHLLAKYNLLNGQLEDLNRTVGSLPELNTSSDLLNKLQATEEELRTFRDRNLRSEAALAKAMADVDTLHKHFKEADSTWTSNMKEEMFKYEAGRSQLLQEIESLKNIKETAQKRAVELDRLSMELSESKRENQNLRHAHKLALDKSETLWRHEIENSEKSKIKALDATRSEFQENIASLKQKSADDVARYSREIETERLRRASMLKDLQARIDDMQAQHSKELEQQRKTLNADWEAKVKNLQREYDILTQRLRKGSDKPKVDSEEQQLDWVEARDDVHGLTDLELVERVKKLATKIEQFSMRVKWDVTLESKWPMPDHTLVQLHPENPRKLKQQILQSSIWEGEKLCLEWKKQFGADATSHEWPQASTSAENWRHNIMYGYFDAMNRSGPISDAERKRKDIVEASIIRIAKAMYSSIGRVAPVGLSEQQGLQDIAGHAGKMWLEFCSQPYRIHIGRPTFDNGSSHDVLAEERVESVPAPLTLIVRPEMVRMGNSLGEDLSLVEGVRGWKADMVDYKHE
ncbi:hypothetical protein BDV96DRAFT_645953 [Lophiotrema nucula]|uniref:Uncharacterized protein n=1 Tax=Lophiotrema nucula TaxID=690887 RepID=A0A6A5ZBK1_9PLEO|nr:hypothetical protein BDV96DRAFT_645953 [Lophiotrema nucula]